MKEVLVAIDPVLLAAIESADLKHAQFSAEHIARGDVYTDYDDECRRESSRVAFANDILAKLRSKGDES